MSYPLCDNLETLSNSDVLKEVSKILHWKRGVHDGVILEVFKRLEYQKVESPKLGQVVVDAGAGIGSFTVKASLQVGASGLVYAFEPERENFRLLKKNTANLSNVKIYNKALWSSSELRLFHVRSDHWAGHNFYNWGVIKDVIKVKTVKLDGVVKRNVHFLKIDVEKAELEVLKGAQRMLAKSKPFIAVEIHDSKLFEQISQFLGGFGYKRVGATTPYALANNVGTQYFRC